MEGPAHLICCVATVINTEAITEIRYVGQGSRTEDCRNPTHAQLPLQRQAMESWSYLAPEVKREIRSTSQLL